jgi:thioredoxin 1
MSCSDRRVRPSSVLWVPLLCVVVAAGCGWAGRRTSNPEPAGEFAQAPAVDTQRAGSLTRPRWSPPDDVPDPPPLPDALVAADDRDPVQPASFHSPAAAANMSPPPRPAAGGIVTEITADDFEQVVLGSEIPVLVDFYADWCKPCKKLVPVLDQLAQETPDVKVVKVNIDDHQQLAKLYRVRSLPTLMVFKQGVPVSRHSGLADQAKLQQLLDP